MAFLKSLYRSDDSQLMLIVDTDTDTPLKNDKGDEMGIHLTSTDSEPCKKVIAKFNNQHKKAQPSYAQKEKFSLDLLVAATTGFHNIQLEENGGVIEFAPEAARDMYENSNVIRKQVDRYLGNDDHFLEKVLAA